MLIFLIGYMGSGKTTLGKQVAAQLGYDFIDMDDFIEQKQGVTIAQLFAQRGEGYFRELENKAIKELALKDETVIATGGGSPCFFDNMEIINKAGLSIYLRISSKELAKRLKNEQEKRPLIAGKNAQELFQFIDSTIKNREKYYCKAKYIVQSDTIGIADLLSKIKA